MPVIISLVAVLLFLPTQLMSGRLRKTVEEESINNGGREIKRLETSAVSREQYEKEAELQKAHAADANEIANLARQTTQRELLSYDIFPAPEPNGFSGLIFQKFGLEYRKGIDNMVLSVNGRDCPTDAEIDRGLEDSSSRSRSRRGGGMFPSRSASSRSASSRTQSTGLYPGGSMRFGRIERMIVDEMCKDRARTISVYVNPADISGYEYWADYKYDVKLDDGIEDCFYHQLAYWIIEDILDTISAMNSGHENVLTAPVKRFMGNTFTMGLKRPRSGGGGVYRGRRGSTTKKQSEDADRPAYVRTAADGLADSCTGRFCGDDLDVTHFNFSVIVSTKSVLPFMKELCSAKEHQFRGYPDPNQPAQTFQPVQTFKHNQVTVLESKIGSINPNDMTHRNYSYGDENVVTLDLVCEYIFDVKGYECLTPEPVKKTLAGEDEEE